MIDPKEVKLVYRCNRCGYSSTSKHSVCPKCQLRTSFVVDVTPKVVTK